MKTTLNVRWLTLLILFFASTILKPSYAQTDQRNESLKILTWNIYMLPSIVPLPSRAKRSEKIMDTLSKGIFDIIVFQEAFHKKTQKKLAKGLATTYPYMYGPFNPTKNPFKINSGVWIISKTEMNVLGSIVYKSRSGVDQVSEKGAALLEGVYNGHKFQLLGTHMQADYKPKIREKQFDQMNTELLYKYKEDGVPQIICGDLNTERGFETDYIKMLTQLDAIDGDIMGLQQETYDGLTNEIVAKIWGKKKTNFDYVLIKKNGANINSEKRWVSVLKCKWNKKKCDLSDHYGIACELDFSN